jgi:hypothetical protein
MFINKLLRGSTNSLPAYFKDSAGLPITLSTPPIFTFTDANNDVIVTGLCAQDNVDASKWIATFTIPTQVTVTIDEETAYTLTFTASLPNNTTKQISRLYEVAEQNFAVVNNNIPLVVTSDSYFADLLQISYPFQVSRYTVALRNDIGAVFKTYDPVINPTVYATNQKYNIYRFGTNDSLADITNSIRVGGNLQVIWQYVVNGNNYTKINPIYIINAQGFALIQDLRMVLDKYRFVDLDPNLQWHDYELLHFVIKGVQRINATNPPTTFDVTTIPASITYAVSQAALVEACKSWFLAEAQRAFEFQGQDISLTIDRTNYIQTVLDQANSWLDNNLRDLKQSIAIANAYGGRATTTISLSPTANFPGLQSRYWPAARLF